MLFRILVVLAVIVGALGAASGNDPAVWNDRGIRYYKSEEFELAVHCFSRALDERPGDGTIRFNLASSYARLAVDLVEGVAVPGAPCNALEAAEEAVRLEENHAYFRKVLGFVHQDEGRFGAALAAFEAADRIAPADPATLALLGDASYRLDEKEEAIEYWRRSLHLDPGQAKLEQRLEKTKREISAENGYASLHRHHFRVRYDPSIRGARREADRVVAMLENARREVRSVVGHETDRQVPVVLYSPERFNDYMGGHGWTRGVYDGKIRIPFEEEGMGDRTLQALATHEYVHAVIYELTQDRCPAWLNEGLAQVLAGEWNEGAERAAGKMIARDDYLSLDQLERSFLKLPEERVEQAYLQSYLVVEFLLDRYTRSSLRRLIGALSDGQESGEAVREIYHVSTDELLRDAVAYHRSRG